MPTVGMVAAPSKARRVLCIARRPIRSGRRGDVRLPRRRLEIPAVVQDGVGGKAGIALVRFELGGGTKHLEEICTAVIRRGRDTNAAWDSPWLN